MKTIAKLKLSTGRIAETKQLKDGCYEFTIISDEEVNVKFEVITKKEKAKDNFVLVEASKLSLKDEFMKFIPKTTNERTFYALLSKVIENGIKDFWRSQCDPSFDVKQSQTICYDEGRIPAVGRSYNWWESKAREYNPKRRSRLGTRNEYIAFLGVVIKMLVEEGWKVEDAWNAVCNDSKQLGHYANSENATKSFEATGSRKFYMFSDLANTCKILADGKEPGVFWLAGGRYCNDSTEYPLAAIYCDRGQTSDYDVSVGWIVME